MSPIRTIIERPVAGGEKFSAVIGPSPVLRRATRVLTGLALVLAAVGIVFLRRGGGGVVLEGSLVLLVLSVVCGWIAGGRETLVCQGNALSYRRSGVFRDRWRSVSVLDVVRIRPPSAAIVGDRSPGFRIETTRVTWTVGRNLPPPAALELATALEQHLQIGPREAVTREAASRVAGARTERPPTPLPAAPEKVLRMRNPPGP